MHQALLVQEVVHMVMRHIRNEPDYRTKTKTLFNAALTCSSFLEPALDALWHDMQHLAPLFRLISNLFPSFSLEPAILSGAVREKDITKFKKYASRVRSFSYQQEIDDVDISVYIHILRASGRFYVFPNLVELTISSELDVPKIMFLMSPNLRKFSMRGSSTSPVRNILKCLQIITPNCSHLTLFNMPVDYSCILTLSSLSRLQGITLRHNGTGNVPTFDLSLFPTLSCKNSLRNFTLDGLRVIWSDNLLFGAVEFPLLESLDFGLCFLISIFPITEFFRYMMVPSLKSMQIKLAPSCSKLDKSVETRYWHQFFDLLGKATTNHFKILEIMPHGSYPAQKIREYWEPVCLTVSGFLNFDNIDLETFSITPPILSFFFPSELHRIIDRWPNLSKLELTSCNASGLDFTALLDIAVGLPRLKVLDVPLNLRTLNVEGIPLLSHNLQCLHLGNLVPLKPYELLVQCVDRIFPHLTHCVFYHGDHSEMQDVSSFFRMLQSARRDELRRATLGIRGVPV